MDKLATTTEILTILLCSKFNFYYFLEKNFSCFILTFKKKYYYKKVFSYNNQHTYLIYTAYIFKIGINLAFLIYILKI